MIFALVIAKSKKQAVITMATLVNTLQQGGIHSHNIPGD
jgi:hypothetical protein